VNPKDQELQRTIITLRDDLLCFAQGIVPAFDAGARSLREASKMLKAKIAAGELPQGYPCSVASLHRCIQKATALFERLFGRPVKLMRRETEGGPIRVTADGRLAHEWTLQYLKHIKAFGKQCWD
jgi:hypothetical protein